MIEKEIIEGIKILSRYSFNCKTAQRLGISRTLFNYAQGKIKDVQMAEKIISLLNTDKYYKAIAAALHLDPRERFCRIIAEYYWKGKGIGIDIELWHNYTTLLPLLKVPESFYELREINKCFIHAARVVSATPQDHPRVEYQPVVLKREGLVLNSNLLVKTEVENPFEYELKTEDYVSLHFGDIIEKIKKEEYEGLKKISEKALQKFNQLKKEHL